MLNDNFIHKIKANQSICYSITDESYIGAARRNAIMLADNIGFSKSELNKIALIINELGSNLIKHTNKFKDRQLLFHSILIRGIQTFEIMALDNGQGMVNYTQCLKDGDSTAQTLRNGLGSIARLADFFNVYSLVGSGTVVLAQVKMNIKNKVLAPFFMDMSAICLPKIGEQVSGDSWSFYQSNKRALAIVADGLGHGEDASIASELACHVFQNNSHLSPAQIITLINTALKKTRGAAVAVIEIDKIQKQAKFAGLGNISGIICIDKKMRHMVSHDGTAGVGQHRIQEYIYPWSENALLLMHSDGLISHWLLNHYPGLTTRNPAIVAGVMYRDFCRDNDDVSVLIGRESNKNAI